MELCKVGFLSVRKSADCTKRQRKIIKAYEIKIV